MDILSVMLRQRSRKIGVIIPDVVISEKHTDTLVITEHPVERPTSITTSGGAEYIADHAYRTPSEVVMTVGFAGGGSLLDMSLLDTSQAGLNAGLSPKEVYQQLIELQRLRLPIDVITGKRQYQNMLIRSIEVTTDKASENVLMAVITLREIMISETSAAKVAAREEMTLGATTSEVQNAGTKTPISVNNGNVPGSAVGTDIRRIRGGT